jgi:hypothetical protein
MKFNLFYRRPNFVPWERTEKDSEKETNGPSLEVTEEMVDMSERPQAAKSRTGITVEKFDMGIPEELSFDRIVSGATYPVSPLHCISSECGETKIL